MALNTVSINDRLGDGGLTSVAVFAEDSSGNATGLVAPDGSTHSTLGANILTVGDGGRFATVQAAIDYIETQGAFTQITMAVDGAVTTWAQGDSTFALSTTANTTASVFVTPIPFEKMWFKVAGDTFYYPLEEASGVITGMSLSTVRRIEASVATAKALTWYKQNDFTIYLLDAYTSEAFTIDANVCVNFRGNGRNVFQCTITKGAGFLSGKITFDDLIVSAQGANGAFTFAAANTIALEFMSGEIASIQDDFIHPNTLLGSLRVEGVVVTQQPTAVQGHCLAPKGVQGDIVVQDVVWRPISHASIGFGNQLNAYLVDLDTTGARNVVINRVNGFVRDKLDDFADIAIFGSNVRAQTANVMISDCHITAPDTCATTFSIAKLGAASTGCTLSIDNCSINAKNTSGAVKLVDADANPAGACTVKVGRGNSTIKCDAQANITYTRAPSSNTGSATVASGATTSVVTHGLGYTPLTADIQVTPTLLSNAAKFWITAVGAATFQINVDADPGAGTATFAWRIAE